MAVGDHLPGSSSSSSKAEYYDSVEGLWTSVQDFPTTGLSLTCSYSKHFLVLFLQYIPVTFELDCAIFHNVDFIGDFIIKYASVYFTDSFFIIGGHHRKIKYGMEAVNTIKKIDTKNWQWSEVGKLNNARAKHGAVMVEIGC